MLRTGVRAVRQCVLASSSSYNNTTNSLSLQLRHRLGPQLCSGFSATSASSNGWFTQVRTNSHVPAVLQNRWLQSIVRAGRIVVLAVGCYQVNSTADVKGRCTEADH